MHQKGFEETVRISGKVLSKRQVDLIKAFSEKVLFIFDEKIDTKKAALQTRDAIPTYIVRDHEKDPADMTNAELEKLVTESYSAIML